MNATLETFTEDESRCLRQLRGGDLYEGALALILSGRVKNTEKVMAGLRKRGLAKKTKGTWSLTSTGQEQADLVIAQVRREAG